jgi:hypothetical protein
MSAKQNPKSHLKLVVDNVHAAEQSLQASREKTPKTKQLLGRIATGAKNAFRSLDRVEGRLEGNESTIDMIDNILHHNKFVYSPSKSYRGRVEQGIQQAEDADGHAETLQSLAIVNGDVYGVVMTNTAEGDLYGDVIRMPYGKNRFENGGVINQSGTPVSDFSVGNESLINDQIRVELEASGTVRISSIGATTFTVLDGSTLDNLLQGTVAYMESKGRDVGTDRISEFANDLKYNNHYWLSV